VAEAAALLIAELRPEELLDVRDVALVRGFELLHALAGQHRVGDTRVALAAALRDPPGALEAVQKAGDPGRRQEHLPREVDPAQGTVGSEVELREDVEVAQREPVLVLEPRRKLPRERRMRTQEAGPGPQGRVAQYLLSQYLTTQASVGKVVDVSSISTKEEHAMSVTE